VFTSLLGLVIVSHLSSRGSGALQVVSELLGWPQDVTLSLIQKFLSQNYFLKKILASHPFISKMLSPFPSLQSQKEVRCQTNFCQNEDGFPKLLRACIVRLGIRSQPEYDGREFFEHGTEKCVVTVYIGSSPHHVEWSVTAVGHRFKDTFQVVARKALRALCQIYKEEVSDTPLRFFPPLQRVRPVWMTRMRALEGQQLLEFDPSVMYLTAYLLTLDAQYDFLARHHRQLIARAEDAEKRNRKLHVDLTTAQARVATLESHEVIVVEALKQAKDEHVQKLMEAYLVTHNQRRALRIQEPATSNPVQPVRAEDPQILEGHPVSIKGEKKAWELPEGAIVLEGILVFPQAMNKQEHPESSQDPPPELFEPLTMKKIPAPSREIKEAASTLPAPPPSEELQEPVQLEEEFNPVLPSQSPPEEVINIISLLTHPGDISD
jgi:hypothetical protein